MNTAKKILFILIPAWLLLTTQISYGQHAEIIINAENGNVIHEANATHSWFPASLTKVMTLHVTFEALKANQIHLHDTLRTSSHAARQPNSKLGLRTGELITVRDAILALITRSANDAAVVLAEGLGGTEENFAVKMTETAHKLGMYNSHFMNATGLPNQWQVTTAHDLAILAWKTQRNFPEYYPYFGSHSFLFKGRELHAINKFTNTYPGAEGMKTGFTCGSGYNLISSASQNGKRLIGVVLGGMTSPERYQFMINMMNNAFANKYVSSGLNINTMSNNDAGIPPYQLGCGNVAPNPFKTGVDTINERPVYIPRQAHAKRHKVAIKAEKHDNPAAINKNYIHPKSIKTPVHPVVKKIKPVTNAKVSKIPSKGVAKPHSTKPHFHQS